MSKPLQKISRGALRSWCIGVLVNQQKGLCPLCDKPISMSVKGNKSDYVVDHDHNTGEVRGVLHRACNAAEGKIANAAGRWGAKSMHYPDIIKFLKSLVTYLESEGHGVMYPGHKTAEEKAVIAKQKAKVAAAFRRARNKVKAQENT